MDRIYSCEIVTVMAAALGAGSDGGNGPYDVSGTVTEPGPGLGAGGREGYAEIRQGRFGTARGGRGAVGGPAVIRVTGRGEPTEAYPLGVPLFRDFRAKLGVTPQTRAVERAVPESIRVVIRAGDGPPP
jgi:hypothetical protein